MTSPGIHHPPVIFDGKVIRHNFGDGVPVASRDVRFDALVRLACRVLQPWRRPAELFEFREGGIDVCLVE